MNSKQAKILALSLFICATISAQILKPAKWECNLSKPNAKQGDIIEIIFNIKLDATWHLYSNIQNYEIGPLRTSFGFEPNTTYKLIGNVVPVGSLNKYDNVFEVNVSYFEHRAEFRQKIKILSKNPVIKGYYEYQLCSSIDGKCILGGDDFELHN